MIRFGMTFVIVFIVWLFIVHTIDLANFIFGIGISVIVTLVTWEFFTEERNKMIFNIKNWGRFLLYLAVLFYVQVLSHLSVSKRIITGRVNPAIVRVPTRFRTDLGKTLFGNSVTMTPGTLTLDLDKKSFYIHTIGHRKGERIGRLFEKYGIGVTE
jgi:multicomponent Na+:H+ antiporter subunit E